MKPLGNILCKKERFVHKVSFSGPRSRRRRESDEPRPPQAGRPAAPLPPGSPQQPGSGRFGSNGRRRDPPARIRFRIGRFPQTQNTGSDRDFRLELPQKNRNNTSAVSPHIKSLSGNFSIKPPAGPYNRKTLGNPIQNRPPATKPGSRPNHAAKGRDFYLFSHDEAVFCFFHKTVVIFGRLC